MIPALIIALEFGPVQTTGAFRSVDLARYLPEHGFEPHVVTIEPSHGSRIFAAPINKQMLSSMPEHVNVYNLVPEKQRKKESRVQQFIRIFTSFDDGFDQRFRKPLAAALTTLAEKKRFGVVYASAPPFGAARLGERASAMLKAPLVLDMRDAWAEWGMAPFPTYAHYLARRRDERRAFAKAAAVVTVTDRLADVFRRCHTNLPADHFRVVANGFDGPLFSDGLNLAEPVGKSPKPTFDVVYVGSYYYVPSKPQSLLRPHSLLQYHHGGEDWSYRSPLYFFKAWRALEQSSPLQARRLRFHHIGKPPPWLMQMADEHGVADRVTLWGMLPKQALAAKLQEMDAQLATSMRRLDGGDYCLASKTFDYLQARKPILAFVTEGSQRDFLIRSQAAVMCDPDDENAGVCAILSLLEGKVRPSLDVSYVNSFHRREAAARMAEIFRSVMASNLMA